MFCTVHCALVQAKSHNTLLIEQRLKDNHSVSAIAREFNISRARVHQIKRHMQFEAGVAYVYLYYIQDTKIGYVGQSLSLGGRLDHHKQGKYPTTQALNQRAASMGKVTTYMVFEVDTLEHDLNWWEAYYYQQYKADGWELVNKIVPGLGVAVQGLHVTPSSHEAVDSDSFMKSLTIRVTTPVFDALTEACAITNRKDPDEPT